MDSEGANNFVYLFVNYSLIETHSILCIVIETV